MGSSANSELYIGLMSGTSMDGIDAALVQLSDDDPPILLATHSEPLESGLQTRLRSLASDNASVREYGALDHILGRLFATAALALLEQAGRSPQDIRAIGSHGQTVFHHPERDTPFSLQIGDPNLIAHLTGITTVADFRRRDMAAGGQGAPLAPAFHHHRFGSQHEHRVVLNIGGIANVTVLPKGPDEVALGFDTGPGNTLMDVWIRQHRGQAFDRDGRWGASGTVNASLLKDLLDDPYFALPSPKSTGPEYFNLAWLMDREGVTSISPQDVQATLAALTTQSIADAVKSALPKVQRVLVCGGGAHNLALMHGLSEALPDVIVEPTEAAGLSPDWVEAVAFAWLAWRTLSGEPGNLPAVTGARESVVLGGIYPGSRRDA